MSAAALQPCGYACSPASDAGFGRVPPPNIPPCVHSEASHYSIDGEATGCSECEALEHEVEA